MSTKKQRTVKTPSLGLSLIPLLGLVLFLGIGYGKFRFPTQVHAGRRGGGGDRGLCLRAELG